MSFGQQYDGPERSIMDAAAIGMAVLTPDLSLAYANPAFAQTFGYCVSDIIDHSLVELAPFEAGSVANVELQKLAADKISQFQTNQDCFRQDGAQVFVRFIFSAQKQNNTGPVESIIVQIVDRTEDKAREDAFIYREARLNSALEAAGHGVWEHDIRRDKMFYSRQWRRMRGFGDDEEIDGSQEVWIARLHPDDRERILNRVKKQDSGEEGYDTIEYRERHRDGHYVWVLSRGKPIEWDADGNAIRTVGTDSDVTMFKHVEARLAEEKERLGITLQSIADGVISTDRLGRITLMNKAAERMTEWTSEEAVGRRIEEIFRSSTEERQLAANPVSVCLQQGVPYQLEGDHVLTSRSGHTRNVRESAAPVRMNDGEIIGAVMVFQDTTSSRKLQKELAYTASHDSLTGLPNRMAFDVKLAEAVDDARENNNVHALGIVDLDRFKAVNDSSGHAAGDALLKLVVECIRGCMRNQDCAARIGGDEFGLVLHNCDLKNAEKVGQKIIDAISNLTFEWRGQKHKIGASIGFTAVTPKSGNADRLYRWADEACYNAKAGGRGQVSLK